jgi:V8-like Glu-specific endopeptidase
MNKSFDILDPIGTPSWKKVPTDQLSRLPYSAIGRVRVLRDGFEIERGTCWLAGDNTAITAAHVVDSWGKPTVRVLVDLTGESDSAVSDIFIPISYGESSLPYDPWDVALLHLQSRARPRLARRTLKGSTAHVVGFPFTHPATMVESHGIAVVPDAILLLHRADTSGGHSGAPVLNQSGALTLGVHVSGFNGNPYKSQYSRYNTALLLRSEINLMIEEYIVTWG